MGERKTRIKKYLKLRYAAESMGLTPIEYFAEQIGLTEAKLKDRYAHRVKFRIDEIYRIMELIDKPMEEIPIYFPPGGVESKKPPV